MTCMLLVSNMHPAREMDIGESRDRVHVCIFLFLKKPPGTFDHDKCVPDVFCIKKHGQGCGGP